MSDSSSNIFRAASSSCPNVAPFDSKLPTLFTDDCSLYQDFFSFEESCWVLRSSTILLAFTTDALENSTEFPGRGRVPIKDDEASDTFYLCARTDATNLTREIFEPLASLNLIPYEDLVKTEEYHAKHKTQSTGVHL